MSKIIEEALSDIDLEVIEDSIGPNDGVYTTEAEILITEIRRLKDVIRKRNHCVDCGKLNPIDNVCDDCLEAERAA